MGISEAPEGNPLGPDWVLNIVRRELSPAQSQGLGSPLQGLGISSPSWPEESPTPASL